MHKNIFRDDPSVVMDVQFGHLFLVCIKYGNLPVGVSERDHTVVSTRRIILCFSYLLTQNRE